MPDQIDASSTNTELYDQEFYAHRHQSTSYAAKIVLSEALKVLPTIDSAIDYGCGVGTWLNSLQGLGVQDVTGVDGPWVQRDMLEIPTDSFCEADLNRPYAIDKHRTLAMSLEAAEHLYPENAATFVETLCSSAPYILFSAAVPGQQGKNHFNEQWPEYWADLFTQQGYEVVDCLRSRVWYDDQIPFWYRQNVLLVVRKDHLDKLKLTSDHLHGPLSIVHPLIFEDRYKKTLSIKETWKLFRRAVKRQVKIQLGYPVD